MSSPDSQDMTRTTRRSLKTLQHAATDRENLVGRPSKNLKHQLTQDSLFDSEVKRKNISSKETQVNLEKQISENDLINSDASEKYWEILAGKRQVALQEALAENKKLLETIEELKQENLQFKQMLEEANSFVEVIKEELANGSNNDTGIDVNDVSTADETVDEDFNSTELETPKN